MYTNFYDSNEIRGRTYKIENLINKYYKKDFVCLDLGCGSCRKIIPLANLVKKYYAIDCDENRILDAEKKCAKNCNITLGVADNFYLPFNDDAFDLVSCFMSKCSLMEVDRVLKKNGLFIYETLGCNDKLLLKKEFGKDHLGWRGRLLNLDPLSYIQRIKNSLQHFFQVIDFYVLKYTTELTYDSMIKLFMMTKEIRHFDPSTDGALLAHLSNENHLIKIDEEKLIFICEKN